MDKRKAGMTPKQQVLKQLPEAFSWKPFSISDWEIHVSGGKGKVYGTGHYEKDAWANALSRLKLAKQRKRS